MLISPSTMPAPNLRLDQIRRGHSGQARPSSCNISLSQCTRWGRPYFQLFFGAMPEEAGLIAPFLGLNLAASSTPLAEAGGYVERASLENRRSLLRGTEGSNLAPSSGESV